MALRRQSLVPALVLPSIDNNAVSDDDPLNLKLKSNKQTYRAVDPLKAKTNNSEDPLKLKSTDAAHPAAGPR